MNNYGIYFFIYFSFPDKNNSERVKLVTDHIMKLQSYVQTMENLEVDATEFAYLKALILFCPGKKKLFFF